MHQFVMGIIIHAKKVVVALMEENQLNAIAPVVERHMYVIAIAMREQQSKEAQGRPLLSIFLNIAGIIPISAMATWTREATNSSSDPIPQRQMSSTTLTISGRTRIPA